MTAIDDTAKRLMALQVLADRVGVAIIHTKDELRAQVSPGTTLRPVLEGAQVGSISYTLPKPRGKITDPDALGAWTADHHPTEAHQYWRCTPAFAARLLTLAEAAEQPIGLHGEVDDPPRGITVVIGQPYIRAAVNPDLADAIWREALTMTDLQEIMR